MCRVILYNFTVIQLWVESFYYDYNTRCIHHWTPIHDQTHDRRYFPFVTHDTYLYNYDSGRISLYVLRIWNTTGSDREVARFMTSTQFSRAVQKTTFRRKKYIELYMEMKFKTIDYMRSWSLGLNWDCLVVTPGRSIHDSKLQYTFLFFTFSYCNNPYCYNLK